ncbi:MAG: 7-carboxy-7-deazaguanine synthase [Gammaproteobacteria bacterium]|jgi:7-carboxy-7-deazaguanine synthase (Cx14CxxC type)|nr:7-carboxy-7-deazaguanine synthase [Gammaproteobacteria bacterium]
MRPKPEVPAVYHVKEIFYSLQGEGARTGRAAVFCRFAGCNLWSGRERDRDRALCAFCDTDFRGTDGEGGARFAAAGQLADAITATWGGGCGPGIRPYVVLTGGEPLLQLDEPLITALHDRGFEVAVETNGTRPAPPGLDWVCVSPKAGVELVQRAGDELKLVYPQPGAAPEAFAELDFRHFFLQPLGGPDQMVHTRQAVAYCLAHPRWRLSLQTHKLLGIP